jgi:hypothetical protein
VLVALALAAPPGAGAIPVSGTIPALPPPFNSDTVTIDVDVAFNAACSVGCTLEITLAHVSTAQLRTVGQTLVGITFEPNAPITIDRGQSRVIVDRDAADLLVGAASATASSELTAHSIIDVTRHWGLDVLAAPVIQDGGTRRLGSYVVSSVADVAGAAANQGLIGAGDLFTGFGIVSSVEPSPPDGTRFALVNDATCSPGTSSSSRPRSASTSDPGARGTLSTR